MMCLAICVSSLSETSILCPQERDIVYILTKEPLLFWNVNIHLGSKDRIL